MSEPARTASTGRRHVLVVGGSPDVRLAWCTLLGNRGLDVSLLRWDRHASPAEWSRHCGEALWLGAIDAGVRVWCQTLDARLRDGPYTDVLPVDALSLAVLCSGRLAMPPGVELVGPQQPSVLERGVDRLRMFDLARATGWSVPIWQHVTDPNTAVQVDRALVVRPRWDVRIIADRPARFSTRRVVDSAALDAKLRDDVPRGEVLLQAAPDGRTIRLCAAARAGHLLGCWRWPAAPQPGVDDALWHESVRALVQRLDWTGVIELELEPSDRGPLLVDVHPGGQAGFVELVRSGSWASPGTDTRRGADLMTLATVPAPRHRLDPVPRLAAPLHTLRVRLAKAGLRIRVALAGISASARQPIRLTRTSSVLVVCKGNINRSIVAEQLLRAAGFQRTTSAGLLDLAGRRPSRAAEAFLAETLGLRPGMLRSRSLRDALDRDGPFDTVFCFERRQLVEIADRYPELRGRIQLFGTLAPALGQPVDIADPHGRSAEEYRACFDRIQAIVVAACGASGAPAAPPRLHRQL